MLGRISVVVMGVALLIYGASAVVAADATSAHYILRDPVIDGSGGYSSSGSYQLFSSQDFIVNSTSSSATFGSHYGFLPFPVVTPSSISASLTGDTTASISWSAAVGYLGWSVGGYALAQSAVSSDGPFTYTNLGNVLTTSVSSLTPATTYYFAVVAKDALGNPIATSSVASITTLAAQNTNGGGGGGGGTHGNTYIPYPSLNGAISFKGFAFPGGTVFVLDDGVRIAELNADSNGTFGTSLNLPLGTHIISIYGVDVHGVRTSLISFSVTLTALTHAVSFDHILLPPTIALQTLPDGTVRISGSTLPNASVTAVLTSPSAVPATTVLTASASGEYTSTLAAKLFTQSDLTLRTFAALGALTSPFSYSLKLAGITSTGIAPVKGDLNDDSRVNLIDFSVLAYWYHKQNPPARFDLDHDGTIGIADFSILAFYWSG